MKRMAVLVAMLAMACGGGEDPLRFVPSNEVRWLYAADNAWVNPASDWCVDAQAALSPTLRSQLATFKVQPFLGGHPSTAPKCETGAVICSEIQCDVGFRCCGPVPPGDYTISATIEVGNGTALGSSIMIFAR